MGYTTYKDGLYDKDYLEWLREDIRRRDDYADPDRIIAEMRANADYGGNYMDWYPKGHDIEIYHETKIDEISNLISKKDFKKAIHEIEKYKISSGSMFTTDDSDRDDNNIYYFACKNEETIFNVVFNKILNEDLIYYGEDNHGFDYFCRFVSIKYPELFFTPNKKGNSLFDIAKFNKLNHIVERFINEMCYDKRIFKIITEKDLKALKKFTIDYPLKSTTRTPSFLHGIRFTLLSQQLQKNLITSTLDHIGKKYSMFFIENKTELIEHYKIDKGLINKVVTSIIKDSWISEPEFAKDLLFEQITELCNESVSAYSTYLKECPDIIPFIKSYSNDLFNYAVNNNQTDLDINQTDLYLNLLITNPEFANCPYIKQIATKIVNSSENPTCYEPFGTKNLASSGWGKLIEVNPDICKIKNENGNTFIHLAITNKLFDVGLIAITNHPELGKIQNNNGKTFIHLAAQELPEDKGRKICECAIEKDKELLNLLDKNGENFVDIFNRLNPEKPIELPHNNEEEKENPNQMKLLIDENNSFKVEERELDR